MYRLIALVLVFSLAALAADSLPLAAPESVGMSAERLDRIGDWLDGVVERREAAGFVTLVARRGKVVHHEAHGFRGMTVREPMTSDALFDLASMTKPLTVAAALMLLEEGRFTMSDPISKYLPEFEGQRVRVGTSLRVPEREVTVHDLFTHRSGIGTTWSMAERYGHRTLKDYVGTMAKLPLNYEPGSTWLYGDSHDVLGYLVEVVGGIPLGDLMQRRLFDPLGMTDTHYWVPASKEDRRAVLVVGGKDDLDSTSRRPLPAAKRASLNLGQSGLYSTAADYWRFCQMMLNGGKFNGTQFLGPRTVGWINDDHLGDAAGFERPGQTFGLGHAVTEDSGAQEWYYSEGSYFWGGSQGTVFWIDPQEELVGVLMVQVSGMKPLKQRERFAALVYAAIVD